MPRIARRPFTVAPAAPGVELFDRPSALELEPLQRDRFEGVGVAQRLRLRGDATLHGRVEAIAPYLLGHGAFPARRGQRHRGVGTEGARIRRVLAFGVPTVGRIYPPKLTPGGCAGKSRGAGTY